MRMGMGLEEVVGGDTDVDSDIEQKMALLGTKSLTRCWLVG